MPELRIDNLFARRSIRRFTQDRVTDNEVERLLQAAMAAPSAGNRKPWHFVVVRDIETLQELADSHPYAKMLPTASVCIVPCGEPQESIPALRRTPRKHSRTQRVLGPGLGRRHREHPLGGDRTRSGGRLVRGTSGARASYGGPRHPEHTGRHRPLCVRRSWSPRGRQEAPYAVRSRLHPS